MTVPSTITYNASLDSWMLAYNGADDDVTQEIAPTLPSGDFAVICQVTMLPTVATASVGIMLGAPEPLYYVAGSGGTGPVPVWLMVEYENATGVARCMTSIDGVAWTVTQEGLLPRPDFAGLVLRYSDPPTPVLAQVAKFRVLDGLIPSGPDHIVNVAPGVSPIVPPPVVTTSTEPILHVVIGAQYGDLDVDVGKSVRWLMFFADRNFILDVNLGDTRYYVVNWAKTFPEALHSVTGINYFRQPAEFRKEQFRKADIAWNFNDTDWVLFCDASEGFSVDNRSLPDDWAMAPFSSYLYREIARAVAAGKDWACLPFFVFTEHTDVANVGYPIGTPDPANPGFYPDGTPVIYNDQPIGVPYYIPQQGLRRLIKVSALRNPSFAWSTLDTPATPDSGAKAQIISYAYAHWNLQDIVPPATTVEPLSLANDDGFRMRKLVSMVRPVTGLPFDDPHWDPVNDAQGLAGPSADIATYNQVDITTPHPGVTPDPACAGILAPLYDQVFRINLRDGVWYEGEGADPASGNAGALGNIPLAWDETLQTWVPGTQYSPQDWQDENWVTTQ